MLKEDKFLRFSPLGVKKTIDIETTTDRELQLWQEFTMIRHNPKSKIYGRKATAPYIDQAKIYYQDARSVNWESAGLLYYYSFLNLAKAFIIRKRSLPSSLLRSSNIYHGLEADPQSL